MILTLDSIHQMPQTLFNKTSLYSPWVIVVITFLFKAFAFLCSLPSSTKTNTALALIQQILQ